MIGGSLGHAAGPREHFQDAHFGPRLWAQASGGVSARRPRFNVKILMDRGQQPALAISPRVGIRPQKMTVPGLARG